METISGALHDALNDFMMSEMPAEIKEWSGEHDIEFGNIEVEDVEIEDFHPSANSFEVEGSATFIGYTEDAQKTYYFNATFSTELTVETAEYDGGNISVQFSVGIPDWDVDTDNVSVDNGDGNPVKFRADDEDENDDEDDV